MADTAGLRATKDQVEAIGIERALAKYGASLASLLRFIRPSSILTRAFDCDRADVADIKLCVLSLEEIFPRLAEDSPATTEPAVDHLTLELIDKDTLVLLNKSDSSVATSAQLRSISRYLEQAGKDWIGKGSEVELRQISVKEGTGLNELAKTLTNELKRRSVTIPRSSPGRRAN